MLMVTSILVGVTLIVIIGYWIWKATLPQVAPGDVHKEDIEIYKNTLGPGILSDEGSGLRILD
jgi:hypothetical protein